jgi:phosphatidylglycerol:prolipoprotein diacylglycerol transferase
VPFRAFADAAIPATLVGLSFGRIGCFLRGCCWGSPTASPLALVYSDFDAPARPIVVPLHPTQLYEAVLNFANYGVLAWLYKRRPAPGVVLSAYLIVYGVGRFVIELFRGDADRGFVLGGMLSTSQAIAIGMVVVGAVLLFMAPRTKPETAS